MEYSGDFEGLRLLITRLETVGEVPRDARAQLAAFALARVRAGFSDSSTPEGATWAALRYRSGRPLVLTGKLSGSFRSRIFSGGFAIESSVPYAGFHQGGTRNVPARRMLPRDGSLPEPWRAPFERVLGAVIVRHFQ